MPGPARDRVRHETVIWLPQYAPVPIAVAESPVKGRVLIVEDEAAIREMLGYALVKDGFSVEEAGDAEAAPDWLDGVSLEDSPSIWRT